MSLFAAPDGSNQPINNTFVQYFEIPYFGFATLVGQFNADWEQAVVVYIDGARQPTQLGTYQRTHFLTIPPQSLPIPPRRQKIMLAGWHKRSGPDGAKPFNASRGRTIGSVSSWDDSHGDNDFDDYSVDVRIFDPLSGGIGGKSVQGLSHPASVVTALIGQKEAAAHAPDEEARAVLDRQAAERLTQFVDDYGRHWCETVELYEALPSPERLASELAVTAHTFHEGRLREQLLQAAGRIAAAGLERRKAAG